MSTDYDAIAKEYKRSKLAPWHSYIERYSLLNLLGEVRGKVGSSPRLRGRLLLMSHQRAGRCCPSRRC